MKKYRGVFHRGRPFFRCPSVRKLRNYERRGMIGWFTAAQCRADIIPPPLLLRFSFRRSISPLSAHRNSLPFCIYMCNVVEVPVGQDAAVCVARGEFDFFATPIRGGENCWRRGAVWLAECKLFANWFSEIVALIFENVEIVGFGNIAVLRGLTFHNKGELELKYERVYPRALFYEVNYVKKNSYVYYFLYLATCAFRCKINTLSIYMVRIALLWLLRFFHFPTLSALVSYHHDLIITI